MLLKKYYMAIAEIIAMSRCSNPVCDVESGINQGCQDIAHRLMEYFEQIDPQFSRKQFDDICSVD